MRAAGLFLVALTIVMVGGALTINAVVEARAGRPDPTALDARGASQSRPGERATEGDASGGEFTGGVIPAASLANPASVTSPTPYLGVATPDGPTTFATLSFPPAAFRAEGFTVADGASPVVPLFRQPGVPFADGRVLTNPTSEGSPLVTLVRQDAGDWLLVQIPARPNGAVAWVRRADITLRTVPDHIVVERGAQRLTMYHGTDVIRRDVVAVGSPKEPTPLGDFYVDALRRLVPATGEYGAGQLSVSGFSTVLYSWAGGQGQIALHGTNLPGPVRGAVSHGCVRLAEQDLLTLLDDVPTGTPVSILP